MNDAPRTQEEQRFEERVSEEVEHARPIVIYRTAYPQASKQETKLADRGEGQHPFEVGLYESNRRSEDGANTANPGNHLKRCRICRREEWKCASYHIDARRDHGRGVDQGADRRGTLHSSREPELQRHLRRLSNGTTEDQDHGQRQQTLVPTLHVCP